MRYGAGIIFQNRWGEILLLKNPKGVWEFPGGGREEIDRTLWDTARREAHEETGFAIVASEPVMDRHFVAIEPDFRYKSFVWNVDKPFEPRLSKEHTDYTWRLPEVALHYDDIHEGVRMVLEELA